MKYQVHHSIVGVACWAAMTAVAWAQTEPPPREDLSMSQSTYETAGPEVPEVHQVVTGDTLWDISGYYYNDPWRWPKVWALNPQIKDAHWIYPGDQVRLLPGEGSANAVARVVNANDGDGTGAAAIVNNTATPPPAPTRLAVRSLAFAQQSDIDVAARVDGATEERLLLSTNDQLYLTYPSAHPPEIGKRYAVYKIERPVTYEGKNFGSYVRVLGHVEVLSHLKDKRVRAVVTEVRREIERGALVGPLAAEFVVGPAVPPSADATGEIVAMMRHDELVGQGEVVLLSVGSAQGLEVGNRMSVIRRGDAYDMARGAYKQVGKNDFRFPARPVGEVAIADVGKNVSIGVVTGTTQELGVGDRVLMQRE